MIKFLIALLQREDSYCRFDLQKIPESFSRLNSDPFCKSRAGSRRKWNPKHVDPNLRRWRVAQHDFNSTKGIRKVEKREEKQRGKVNKERKKVTVTI
jgi:hypothetical protein